MGAANRRRRTAFAGFVLLSLLAGAAGAQDSPPLRELQPVSSWVVDYADDSCALRRTFGSAEQPVWLEMRQFSPGYDFLVTVASSVYKSRQRPPTARFLPTGPKLRDELTAYGIYGAGVEGVAFPYTLVPERREWDAAAEAAREKTVTGLSIEHAFNADFVLETGQLHKPMEAMRTCLDDLLKGWGVDPETYAHLKQQAQPVNQERWARPVQARFPTGLFRIGGSSVVGFRLVIDEAGKVAGCKVQRPVVDPDYEKEICEIFLKQAKFSPALDAAGKPVRTVYQMRVVYRVG